MLALVGSRIGFEEVFRRFNEEKEIRKTIRWAEPTGRRSGTAALLRQLTNRFSSGSSGERNGDFQNGNCLCRDLLRRVAHDRIAQFAPTRRSCAMVK